MPTMNLSGSSNPATLYHINAHNFIKNVDQSLQFGLRALQPLRLVKRLATFIDLT